MPGPWQRPRIGLVVGGRPIDGAVALADDVLEALRGGGLEEYDLRRLWKLVD